MNKRGSFNYRNLFIEVMENFMDEAKCNRLFKKIEKLYQVKPYKITKTTGQEAILHFQKINERYYHGELNEEPNDWHKNERKSFNWFLVCYCEINNILPNNIADLEWQRIGKLFNNKTDLFVKFQGLNIIKKVNKYHWDKDDDQLLRTEVRKNGINKWNEVSKNIFFERNKFITPKQCRERWFNHVNDELDKGDWTSQQDYKILRFSLKHGKKWSKMIKILKNRRTEHMIKNRYYSLLHKNKQQGQQQNAAIQQLLRKIEQFLKENQRTIPQSQSHQYQHENEQEFEEQYEEQIDKNQQNIKDQLQPIKPEEQKKIKKSFFNKDDEIRFSIEQNNQGFIDFTNRSQEKVKEEKQEVPTIYSNFMHMSPFTFQDDNKFANFDRQAFGVDGFSRSQELLSNGQYKQSLMMLSSSQILSKNLLQQPLREGKMVQSNNSCKDSLQLLKAPTSELSQQLKSLGDNQKQQNKQTQND